MTLAAGTKLGPYEILAPLGAGGMGEVYRARDSRLGRDVALKVLPESFSKDPDRLRRFEQEARAASQLNHPNIVTVHDFGTYEDAPYAVQELLEGETLRERLRTGALPASKAVEYGIQVARGLAAAHEKGIVHRDLKPENLFLTSDDRLKILDFGLAKLTAAEGPVAEQDGLPTVTQATAAGIVMGTLGYMAPEQARGQTVDQRADIFALGAILYEMLSGASAFKRGSSADTMSAILKEDPPELPSGSKVPPVLERIVRRCLEKQPNQRFQDVSDVAFALEALSGTASHLVDAAVQTRPLPRWTQRHLWPAWLAGAVAGAAVVLALALLLRHPPRAERMQFAIPVPAPVSHLALSTDGAMLAFVARDDASGENMLYVQRMGSASASMLSGTEGASYPLWSPDGAYVAFFASGKLKKVAVAGGPPQTIAEATFGRGGAWGSRGIIVYAPDAVGPLWRVNADGTNPAPLTNKLLDLGHEDTHRSRVVPPDGDHFLFWAGTMASTADNRTNGIYVSSLA